MHGGWQWLNSQEPQTSRRWQDHYEPTAQYVPSSEQNVQALQSALAFAHQRIRQQEIEIQQLRQAFADGSRMNQYLAEEVEKVKAQLRRERQARKTVETQDVIQDEEHREPFPSVAFSIPSPRSLPTPFHSGEGGESSSRRFLEEELRVEDLPEEVPTVGSVGHPESCKPCFYMFNKKGCHFGRSCLYCHMDHVKKKKERPPKLVRQECRELANQVFRDAATASSASSSNLEETLRRRVELARASQVTTNYAASVLRALGRHNPVTPEDVREEVMGWHVPSFLRCSETC